MTAPVGSLAAYLSVRGAAQARQDILSVQRQLGLAGEAATSAGAAMDRSEAAITGAGRASVGASSRANQLRAAQLGVVSATERYNAVLASGTENVGRLASSEASLIRAKERVASVTRAEAAEQAKATDITRSAALANSEMVGSSSRMGSAMGGTVKQLGLMFGGFELLKKAIDYGKEASQFQREMLLIQTNANASATEVRNMTAAILKLSPQVATGPLELAQALYHVEQNGLRGQVALDALRVGAEGAKIGMASVEDTTNTMTIALASGIKGMGSMQQAMGTMIAIAGTGDMRLKDLNEALSGGILAVAKGFGATLGDVAAVLATLGDNGIRGADAATALRQTLMGFAQPAKGGASALASVGLAMHDLRDEMEKHGLVAAMNDLDKHMTAAGVTGAKVGGFITQAFGRKAGAGISVLMGEIDRLNIKFDEGAKGGAGFASKWAETTKTAAFQWKQFGVEIQTGAIALETKALPAITSVGHALAVGLPAGLHLAHEALTPFIAGWHVLADILPPVGHALEDVGSFLGPLAPVFKFLATDVLATWAAFKGYQAARFAINAISDVFATMKARAVTGLTSIRAYGTGVNATLSGNATEAQLTSGIMQVEFAKIEASALAAAAAIDKAAMNEAVAFADMTAASKASSDAQVLAADRAATAATVGAAASARAAAVAAAAAVETAAVVDEAGATAAVGWAALLGPVAAVAIAVSLLVSMFHRSAQSTKEATDAAKAYGDVLSGTGKIDLFTSIQKQLTDNNVPEKIDNLNKSLGSVKFTSLEFAQAVDKGGDSLRGLASRLGEVITQNGVFSSKGHAALVLLKDVTAQSKGLTDAIKKDLSDTKAFAGVSSSIDKVSQSTQVGSKTAQTYAQMLGIVVDKNGVAAVSAATLQAAVDTVSKAYNTATQAGSDFLGALNSFSQSAGTAADRAALIGSTLKAANGDALGFAAAMTGAYSANRALIDGFKADADKIAGLRAQIAALGKSAGGSATANQLLAAQINKTSTSLATNKDRVAQLNREIASGKLSASGLAAAQRELANAQATGSVDAARLNGQQDKLTKTLKGSGVDVSQLAALQKQLADAYKNSELAAINLNKGTIDYTKGGAPALVGQLQAIQDASVKAAGATFQHELATKGATKAADDAFNLYRTQTEGSLIAEAKQLGLTHDQAKKLADTYFGLQNASDIKKTIEMEGSDPVVTVLNKIGKLLAYLTGKPWDIPISVSVHKGLPTHVGAKIGSDGQITGFGYASGTTSATAGWRWVGEHGPELMNFRGGEKVLDNKTSMKAVAAATDGGKHLHLHGDMNLALHYPKPGGEREALPLLLRAAENQFGSG